MSFREINNTCSLNNRHGLKVSGFLPWDMLRDVNEISAGNIAVVSGLKLSRTGDTIVSSQSVAKAAIKVKQGFL